MMMMMSKLLHNLKSSLITVKWVRIYGCGIPSNVSRKFFCWSLHSFSKKWHDMASRLKIKFLGHSRSYTAPVIR